MSSVRTGPRRLELPSTRQADVKASLKEVSAVSQAEIDFGLDGQAHREYVLPLAGRNPARWGEGL
jgi:hypothetical protein